MLTKIQDFLNSLNGLLRLYVTLVVFVLLPIAIHEAKTTINHRVTEVVIFREMPSDVQKYLEEKKIELYIKNSEPTQRASNIDWSKAPTEDSSITVAWKIPYDGGDFMMKLPKNLDEKTTIEVGDRVQKALDSNASKRYWKYVFENIALNYLMIAIAILLAGYVFVWNFRGFVKKRQ